MPVITTGSVVGVYFEIALRKQYVLQIHGCGGSSGRRGDRPHCDLVLLAGARGEEGLEPGAAPIF
eukprot:COSAG02_NODE_88_length_38629_cov_457.967999_19_plen_65_part_00